MYKLIKLYKFIIFISIIYFYNILQCKYMY